MGKKTDRFAITATGNNLLIGDKERFDSWVFVLTKCLHFSAIERQGTSFLFLESLQYGALTQSLGRWKKTVPEISCLDIHSYVVTFLLGVGFSIELLQTTFQKNFQPATPDPELPLGKEQKKKNSRLAAFIF